MVVFPALSKFTVKLFVELLLDQHQELVVYLNLLQSLCNDLRNKNNLTNDQLYSHPLNL